MKTYPFKRVKPLLAGDYPRLFSYIKVMKNPNCYDCKYIATSLHENKSLSRCAHPDPMACNMFLDIETAYFFNFMWPDAYDPVGVARCDGFEKTKIK